MTGFEFVAIELAMRDHDDRGVLLLVSLLPFAEALHFLILLGLDVAETFGHRNISSPCHISCFEPISKTVAFRCFFVYPLLGVPKAE